MSKNRYRRTYRSGISTKKLALVGSLLFGLALSVSATSTYAWYAIQEKYRIAGLSMTLDFDDEYLQVGKKDGNGEITYQEEPYTLEDFGQQDKRLGNISNMYHDTYEFSEDFVPYFYSGYRPGGSIGKTSVAEDSTFVQMEFYCKVSHNAFLYLNPASNASPNNEANQQTASAHHVDFEDLQNVTNAARVSFYSYSRGGTPFYHIAELSDQHEEVDYAGPLDLVGSGHYDVDAEGKEIIYGEINDSILTHTAPLEEDEVVKPGARRNVFNSTHKKGTRKLDVENSELDYSREGAKPLDSYIYEEEPGIHPIPIAALAKDEPTRVVVSIFLEGWDYDMTEALCYASFDFSLGFVAVYDEAASEYL